MLEPFTKTIKVILKFSSSCGLDNKRPRKPYFCARANRTEEWNKFDISHDKSKINWNIIIPVYYSAASNHSFLCYAYWFKELEIEHQRIPDIENHSTNIGNL